MDTLPTFNSYYEKLADGTVRCIDSEIPFEIPDSWAWCRLGSVFNIWSARRVHEKDWRSKGIPFYRAREIGKLADFGTVDNNLFIDRELYEEFSKSGIPQIGDLMMTAVGTLGKTYIVDTDAPFYYKDGSVLCIGNPYGFYSKYLKAFFESTIFTAQYLSESDGTTVATLTMVRMNKYLIPLPPLIEQERIMKKAAPLLSLADIYATKQNQFEKLNSQIVELLKKSILQEAIQGRLVPQIESEGTAEELLKEIGTEKKRLVKEGKLKKSALTASHISRGDDNKYYEQIGSQILDITEEIPFDIPTSWCWSRMGVIGEWGAGATPLRGEKSYYNGDILWLKTGELNNGYIFDTEEKVTDKALKDCSLRLNQIGDILIAMYGATIGKLGIVGKELTTNQACCGCTPYIYNMFLFYLLMASKDDFIKKGEGGAQPNISRIKLVNHLIPLPPIEEQERIVNQIETLFKRIK